MTLRDNLNHRKWLVSRLRAEVVGPDPSGDPLVVQQGEKTSFSWEEFRKPKRQPNGEEILWQDPPIKRYGAGILYPIGVTDQLEKAGETAEGDSPNGMVGSEENIEEKLEAEVDKNPKKVKVLADDSEEYEVTLANAFKPSAIGLSFVGDMDRELEGIRVEIASVGRLSADEVSNQPIGVYRRIPVWAGDIREGGKSYEKSLWFRVPLLTEEGNIPVVDFSRSEILSAAEPIRRRLDGIDPDIEVVAIIRQWRPSKNPALRLITVSLVNRKKPDAGKIDEKCLFQVGIRIRGVQGSPWIVPYPEGDHEGSGSTDALSDEKVNRLLYRQYQTFAIGHGCAADWPGEIPELVSEVWSDVLPACETPSTSADLFIKRPDGAREMVRVSMRRLAGLDESDNGRAEIEQLIQAYADWIDSLKAARPGVPAVPGVLEETAGGLIRRCESCLERMRDGLRFLDEKSETARQAIEAFQLANRAMLIAQLRATREIRTPHAADDGRIIWEPAIENPDPTVPDPRRGYWRAFQIAFILMSLRSICEPESATRNTVDLIWFPTGGGKTEAYLGLTAFTIIFNRLSDRNAEGADVLMRYTLRLLTAQQFQRAALLFCAMEHIRKKDPARLGDKPFRIGLWVGGDATPNVRSKAVKALEDLERNPNSENPFVLLKCPWCGAMFGPTSATGESQRRGKRRYGRRSQGENGLPSVVGFRRYTPSPRAPETVVYSCGDPKCEFGERPMQTGSSMLPVVVIDEDLLEDPPNLVIGTVDKFAILAWKPDARRMFGIGPDGKHHGLPPTLIIQDELHLISGPLGSMVGAYETVIERLCREHGIGKIRPKIIASTATISRAREQIRSLYARDDVFLFPPSGLEADDSFFSRHARNEDGSLRPGRLYTGVLAPAHGSLQTTEARIFACLMQHAVIMDTDDQGRDPWWTLLCFFNSLRELGSAATLFVADARDYLRVILDRQGESYDKIRKLFSVTELTSRIRSDRVPKELERLERTFTSSAGEGDTVDACLASNIIEVGVDVTRLALMTIVGQPKTTSQYIQVSSRVGRDPEKPGLVVALYGQSKPRDRSHYERFRTFHQKLYAQVEPTSVTPFSPPAVDRALHGVIVAAVRQLGLFTGEANMPDPFPLQNGVALRALVEDMIDERVNAVSNEELEEVRRKFLLRLDQWRKWQPGSYGGFGAPPTDPPLMHPAGSTEPVQWNGRSWPTMSSMRNVDATCEADITDYFNKLDGDSI